MVTLKDVASASGVTAATASMILNSPEKAARFKPETVKRVSEAAQRMNYSPNHRARILREGLTRSIGVVLESFQASDLISQPYWGRLISGLHCTLQSEDYQLVIISSTHTESATNIAFRYLRERRIDALALTSLPKSEDMHLLHSAVGPYLILGHPEVTGYPCIYVDDELGVRLSLDRLRESGHSDTLWFGPEDWFDSSADRRANVFAEYSTENGICGSICRFHYNWSAPEGAVRNLLAQSEAAMVAYLDKQHKPSSILCYNGDCAVGVYRALRGAGYSIPEDCSIIAFDSHIGIYLDPPLATISLKRIEMGNAAAVHLLEALATNSNQPISNDFRLVIPPEFLDAESTRELL